MQKSLIEVNSEIGRLKKVFLHTPGREVELMTPQNASELLYNDIIYYKNIVAGHNQLKSVLSLVSEVFEASECLETILNIPEAKEKLLHQILFHQGCLELKPCLSELNAEELTRILITGTPLIRNSLESWLSKKTYSLVPLPNMYFMRDTSVVIGKRVVSSQMASSVRFTEALIMKAIYEYHPSLKGLGFLLDGQKNNDPEFTMEGGDIIVLNPDLLLIGISERTTPRAVDADFHCGQS